MTKQTDWDQETIPHSAFESRIRNKGAIPTNVGHGGVIHQIHDLLRLNAMTKEAIASKLGVGHKTVLNAVAHLKQRHRVDVRRYLNKADGKFYYFLHKDVE